MKPVWLDLFLNLWSLKRCSGWELKHTPWVFCENFNNSQSTAFQALGLFSAVTHREKWWVLSFFFLFFFLITISVWTFVFCPLFLLNVFSLTYAPLSCSPDHGLKKMNLKEVTERSQVRFPPRAASPAVWIPLKSVSLLRERESGGETLEEEKYESEWM